MLRRPTLGRGIGLIIATSLLAACGSDKTTSPTTTANVRIVNASSSTTALNATSGTSALSGGLNFQNTNAATTCTKLNSGSQTINFTSGSSSSNIGSVTYNFLPGQNYTVVYYGTNNVVVYPETFTAPSTGNAALRFVNATASAGDLFLTTPTGTVSGTPTVQNFAAGSISGFNSTSAPGGTFGVYPVANTRVRLFNVGQTTGTPRADFTIGSMAANRVGTVVLTPAPSGGTTTGFLVNSCAS